MDYKLCRECPRYKTCKNVIKLTTWEGVVEDPSLDFTSKRVHLDFIMKCYISIIEKVRNAGYSIEQLKQMDKHDKTYGIMMDAVMEIKNYISCPELLKNCVVLRTCRKRENELQAGKMTILKFRQPVPSDGG